MQYKFPASEPSHDKKFDTHGNDYYMSDSSVKVNKISSWRAPFDNRVYELGEAK